MSFVRNWARTFLDLVIGKVKTFQRRFHDGGCLFNEYEWEGKRYGCTLIDPFPFLLPPLPSLKGWSWTILTLRRPQSRCRGYTYSAAPTPTTRALTAHACNALRGLRDSVGNAIQSQPTSPRSAKVETLLFLDVEGFRW